MTTRRNILRTIVLAFALVSCDATVESEYSRLRAFLRVTPVTAATPLFEAVNNPGIFCKVTLDGAHYIFTRQNGTSTQLNITAVGANYARMQSIYNQGFIVGTPSQTDINTGQFYQVAFDIVCPNCYESSIAKMLTLQGEEAVCPRCGRTYSLANKGIVIKGEKGRKLHRYRMAYVPTQDMFVINN